LAKPAISRFQDVDLRARLLTIRGTKFGKTRLVPLPSSTCSQLVSYIAKRQRHWVTLVLPLFLGKPGALTPTEVMSAQKAGADFVKVSPCAPPFSSFVPE
jgi:integrase